ncbi:hypothetical protein GCM10009744_35350 [Kribbella alba]|uniref:Glyoxalase-like domain-containing protein n=1 Tax=Kribbella alba TaxID=190197 RepID=A0ABP4RC78_9ACTN
MACPVPDKGQREYLQAAGVDYQEESGTSIYFRDPDGHPAGTDRRAPRPAVRPDSAVAGGQSASDNGTE